ncbi:MAG: hypothetical protein V3U29_08560 [Phycisphaeraceae bacterium]
MILAGLVVSWAIAEPVHAQADRVVLTIDPDRVGLGGLIRPGTWTPIRLTLANQSSRPRQVRCQWVLADIDGDLVVAERVVPLTPQTTQAVWLYAVPDVNVSDRAVWHVQVIDEETGNAVAAQRVAVANLLQQRVGVIGVTSAAGLGLDAFSEQWTQHERYRFLRGLDPQQLPDRWHGLSMLDALIWTPDAPSGADPGKLSHETQQAIRQWVRRGGHLIVSMKAVGDLWVSSPLGGMLPPVKPTAAFDVMVPSFLYRARPLEMPRIDLTWFGDAGKGTSVLLRDEAGRPVVVARRYGFGRVTLIGVDLSDPRLVARSMPDGQGLWGPVFGWRSPGYRRQYIDGEVKEQRMARLQMRYPVELGRFVETLIAMRKTATGAMLAAIIVFSVYWLLAGPVGFAVLRRRQAVHHSWVAFTAVVAVFAVVTWGGAVVLRPGKTSIAHFSVLDARGGSDEVHVHSWLSLYVPRHGRVELIVDPDRKGPNANTVCSAGLLGSPDQATFLDSQRYTIDAAWPTRRVADRPEPGGVLLPMRSTAKQLEVDFLGELPADSQWLTEPWVLPQGHVRIVNGWPAGRLSHGLPGALRDVLFVYCPGGGVEPVVYFNKDSANRTWAPGQVLDLPGTADVRADRLVLDRPYDRQRQWKQEGYLGRLIDAKTGHRLTELGPTEFHVADNEVIQAIEMLSFYSTLPPPDFLVPKRIGMIASYYRRGVGRQLDLSAQIPIKQLIVIGHLDAAPLPVPMSVDGKRVASAGWTVVRWVYPLD